MIWIRQIAEDAGATEPVNGSWLIAWANELGVTQPVNGTWWEAIGQHLGLTPVNGSWIEAVAIEYGQPATVNGTWIEAIANGSAKQPAAFVIMAGQSNMRGQGTPFPAEYQGDITGVKIWNGSAFVTLNGSVSNNNQLGQPLGTFGPEMSFLKQLLNDYQEVYCMKYAIGSSSLATLAGGGTTQNWNPATVASYFDNLVSNTNSAIALLPSGYTNLGMFWYQGEADGINSTAADAYYANLNTFYSDFKTETSQPNIKFYITRILNIVDAGVSTISPVVRLNQTRFARDNYENTYLINVDDLGIDPDLTHLTAQGYVDLGLRYKSLIDTPPANVSLLMTSNFSGSTIANKDWVITGTGITQNNRIIFTNNHAGTVTFESGRKLTNRYVLPNASGDIYCRVKMTWTDPVITNQSSGGFLFLADSNNYVGIMTDAPAGANAIRIRRRVAGVNTDTPTTAVNGNEFKIRYNTTTGSYQIWVWNGSAWSSLGTGTGATGRGRFVFTTNDSAAFTGGDEYYFEEFDLTLADFTTRRP